MAGEDRRGIAGLWVPSGQALGSGRPVAPPVFQKTAKRGRLLLLFLAFSGRGGLKHRKLELMGPIPAPVAWEPETR